MPSHDDELPEYFFDFTTDINFCFWRNKGQIGVAIALVATIEKTTSLDGLGVTP